MFGKVDAGDNNIVWLAFQGCIPTAGMQAVWIGEAASTPSSSTPSQRSSGTLVGESFTFCAAPTPVSPLSDDAVDEQLKLLYPGLGLPSSSDDSTSFWWPSAAVKHSDPVLHLSSAQLDSWLPDIADADLRLSAKPHTRADVQGALSLPVTDCLCRRMYYI